MKDNGNYKKVVERITLEDFVSLFSGSETCDTWFSPKEMELYPFPERAKSLAARYLVKKAIGETLHVHTQYKEIEILNNSYGKPEITIGKEWDEMIEKSGIKKILCSLSHSRNHAIGMTIFCH
jgi:phosphopantetheinyl transferase (holo-ACP synthase)